MLLYSFHFSSDMIVRSIGNSLLVILPDLVGKKITNWFDLVRPLIAFKFQTVRRFLSIFTFRHIHTHRPTHTDPCNCQHQLYWRERFAAISLAIAHISGVKISPQFQWNFNALSQNVRATRVSVYHHHHHHNHFPNSASRYPSNPIIHTMGSLLFPLGTLHNLSIIPAHTLYIIYAFRDTKRPSNT